MDTRYTVGFAGEDIDTTVTKDPTVVAQWVAEILSQYANYGQWTVIGLDVEWRPNTVSGMNNPAATLQLCVGTRCLIVQLVHLNYIPRALQHFMNCLHFTFVGVNIAQDLNKLHHDYGLSCYANVTDIASYAMSVYPRNWRRGPPGLKILALDIVGITLDKPQSVTRSDWQSRSLSNRQVEDLKKPLISYYHNLLPYCTGFIVEYYNSQSKWSAHCEFWRCQNFTTVTDKATVIDQWVAEIMSQNTNSTTVVGLDIEWRPNVVPGMNNKTATLQLCVDIKCLIVQLFYLRYVPQSLKNFINCPNFTFVGVKIGEDLDKLMQDYGFVCYANGKSGLKTLARDVVGLHMAKPQHVCRSDWQARVSSTTNEQVEYACVDAYASFRVGRMLIMGY